MKTRPHFVNLFGKGLLITLMLFAGREIEAQSMFSAAAPGAPGADAQWATAGKQAIGSSYGLGSKVWFTLAQGTMTEVYYPDVTRANVQVMQFVVVDRKTKTVETERDDAHHQIIPLRKDSLSFQQVNTAKSGKWKITKTYVTDPTRDAVLIDVKFEPKDPLLNLYVYFDASMGNTGMGDEAQIVNSDLVAFESLKPDDGAASLSFSSKIDEASSFFVGSSDGIQQLKRHGQITQSYTLASDGNVVQMARIIEPKQFTAVLAFSKNAQSATQVGHAALKNGFAKTRAAYEKEWADYVKTIPVVDAKYQAQFNMAAMVMKSQEDKTVRGANVASLTVPWGGGANANADVGGGYHLIWSRDLYHVFTAYMAIGDKAAAERALDFLFKIQQKEDGSFPQNSWMDGKGGWGSLQMDEVGYPLIMAWQLGKFDKETYEKHVKRAADFIVKNGPFTPQERWEERPGYSPSTIAAEIAGLVCAADIAKRNGDDASATIYLAAADDFARNIERWTATTKGKYGDGNYYIRISEKGEPDGGHKIELNNNAGTFPETDIVDAGFLELVRLGIKPANDPLIVKSLKVIDEVIKVETPNGPAFYRYNNDGYGEMPDGRRWNWDGKYTGKGRLWALLSGERGQYELAVNAQCWAKLVKHSDVCFNAKPKESLDHMLAFGNEGLMIPEQIWDRKEIPTNVDPQFIPELKFGEGTGSATPLAWSMGQFIRLLTNIKAGKNLDTPQVVVDRYKNGIPGQTSNFGGMDKVGIIPLKPGVTTEVSRDTQPGTKVAFSVAGRTAIAIADAKGKATVNFTMPSEPSLAIVGVQSPDGSTAFERVKIYSEPPKEEFTPEQIARIKAATASPIIDGNGAIFFYRGKADYVQVVGDMTMWNRDRSFMQKIGDDLFATRLPIDPNARLEYKYTVNGKWEMDPLNQNLSGQNNLLVMPGYKPTEWAKTNEMSGKLETIEIQSKVWSEPRKVQVYVPVVTGNVQQSLKRANPMYRVLYFQDGGEYMKTAKAIEIQESLVKAGKVEPFIMVFIDYKERNKEYWATDEYAKFLAEEVVPEIDKRYRTVADRNGRGVIGASLGGVTSLWTAMKYPQIFSRVGAQSASFWIDNGRVEKELEKLDPATNNFRFYIDDGTLEGVEDSRGVNVLLRGKGFDIKYVEGQTGHNWTSWRDRLADAFTTLMAK